ncbi:zinc transporter ZIP6-like [Girardinichthys multiradiatus]|uniref:zinc transporter ZIP6-like n=1 Tax=Girardinichthys multiradiatus TaxID=208333 RepID=UPI001FAC0308|nr:zinc transporter ZIP6-like [Girardinichthys multiradiatus]XP_047224730.1 zinc transporter ZIP6-like [Girardinichthys multiradiatus]XP_047224731.1 zinc transporter ZIP6-like [Girardinichthys multiradiatus]XP_047224732.1 zinc transporter ZIP6-like [Girardinichthys multiradiatus]
MMNEQMSAAILAVMLLFTASGVLAASDCSPSTTEAPGGSRFLSAVVDSQRAEQSRREHLEALFHRYGENGTISLDGLKRLMRSVGLGRIRNIMVKHREQAGHHHDHHHQHGHHHYHHHVHRNRTANQNRTEESDSHLDLHQMKPNISAPAGQDVRTTSGKGAGLLVKTQKRSLDGAGPSGEGTATAVKERPAQTAAENHHHGHDHDHHHDHHHGHGHDHDHHHDHDDQDQDHLQNRSLDTEECLNASGLLFSHGMSQDGVVALGDFVYLCPALLNQIDSGACLLHGDASRYEDRGHKHSHSHHGDHNHSEHGGGETTKHITAAWVGGFLAITIISMLSLLGVVLIPLMNKVFFKFLLSFLVALAVGTLSGDAFLHLIPHSQGSHQHHHHEEPGVDLEEHHLHEGNGENLDGMWKGLTALGGVYFMFLIEHFLTLGKMYKDKKQKIQKKWDQNVKSDPEKQPALEESEVKPSEDVETNGASTFVDHSSSVAEEEQVMLTPQVSIVSPESYGQPSGGAAGYLAEDCENKCHSHFHDTVGQADSMHHHHHDYHHILHHHHSQNHHPHSHSHSYSEQHFQQAGVATLAWMVIMGDGLHNFSDGLAIGAAFTESLSSGLSTSVAVFCHELPHELGDFAVLLKAGMTVRQAILYNVLSAMMAYLGMVTGILIGHYAENICMWIFALTAGLFMYVALVDMVPEMLHNDAGDNGFSHCGFFLLQNAGILLGFCIMLLIAMFEHKIQLDLGY